MFENIRSHRGTQLITGLLIDITFGFLLQKGGATNYDVIEGQLLLTDFTVAKVIGPAVLVAMPLLFISRHLGLTEQHVVRRGLGTSVIGGLIFGVGFGLLGYCPGTIAGAIGQGSLDALFGGAVGRPALIMSLWLITTASEGFSFKVGRIYFVTLIWYILLNVYKKRHCTE